MEAVIGGTDQPGRDEREHRDDEGIYRRGEHCRIPAIMSNRGLPTCGVVTSEQ
jgi:hypothetical protein